MRKKGKREDHRKENAINQNVLDYDQHFVFIS